MRRPESYRNAAKGEQGQLASRPNSFAQLFDEAFYRKQLANETPRDLVDHYLSTGFADGLSPHPLFSPTWYLTQRGKITESDPFTDYLVHGVPLKLDPHPLFSTEYYCRQAKIDGSQVNPLMHFSQQGSRTQFAPHPWIDLEYCQSQVPRRLHRDQSPLLFMLGDGLRKNQRFHPMFNPARLAIEIRRQDRPVNLFTLAETFVTWSQPYSPSPLFDIDFYCSQCPGLDPARAWQHYMNEGQHRDLDPTPYFDSSFYRSRYSRHLSKNRTPFLHYMTHEFSCRFDPQAEINIRHFLKKTPGPKKSRQSPLEVFIESGRFRSVETVPFSIPSFVIEQAKEAARLEPEIPTTARALAKQPVYNRHMSSALASTYDIIKSSIKQGFKALVIVPHLSRGGADLAATNLVRWLAEQYGLENVLLVVTDSNKVTSSDWLPDGTRMSVLSHFDPKMKAPERELIIQYLIEDFRPDRCYNVNSKAGWNLCANKGKPLSALTKLFAQLFCFDYDEAGRPVGYAISSMPRALEHLTAVYTDNARFCRVLRDAFNFTVRDRAKLKVLYQPIKALGRHARHAHVETPDNKDWNGRAQVFWAGRVDRQKRPDVLVAVAKRCPQHDFHVFGSSVLNKDYFANTQLPDNMTLYGEYSEFFDLPLEKADLFLYTSQWDGLPLILIDMVQSGIPIIAPDVGGISELIDATTGWLVPDFDDAAAYAEAIEEIMHDPTEAKHRSVSALQRLQSQHDWQRYSQTLREDMENSLRPQAKKATAEISR